MKYDPYSELMGLDQRLFQEEKNKKPAKQRDNETTMSRNNDQTKQPANEATPPRSNESSNERRNETAINHANDRSTQRGSEATRTRVSSPRGQTPLSRVSERHSHDIFQDQVRWMNRLKLELEERYGRRVTSNALVSLAIDMLREEYEQQGARSNLIRVLVKGQTIRLAPEVSNKDGG